MSVTGRALGLEGKEERVFLSLVGWRSGSQGNMSQGWSGSRGKHVSRLVSHGETCLKVNEGHYANLMVATMALTLLVGQ